MAEGDSTLVVVRRSWGRRLINELIALLAALAILLAAALVLIDTAPGHRFLVDRIAALETATGLRIRIGRIDGSIFGEAHLKTVTVADGQGVFLTSPEIVLDWAPGAWLYNSLHIDRLTADKVRLERLPHLKPSGKKGPILPGFDIHIGRLDIQRLEVGKAVGGREQVGRLVGSAELRAGRAMVTLKGALNGGDRLAVMIDAEPDRNRFDLEVRATAPGNGLLPALFGSKRPLQAIVTGKGGWARWNGLAVLKLSGIEAGRLALTNAAGTYALSGTLRPAPFVTGKLQRLSAPTMRVSGRGQLKDRQLHGQLRLLSPALRAVARGTLDLAANRYQGVIVGLDLLQPRALFPNMSGLSVRMVWTLSGPFATADYAYRLTSPQVAFDSTGFLDVRAEGRGRLAPWPLRVPLRLQARAVTGIGDVAGGILRNISLEGMLAITPKLVRGDDLALKSDKVSGKMALLIDLATGRFDITLAGGMKRYLIPGIGIVDVETRLHVVPGSDGRAHVVGKAEAWVRRLDNSFFLGLTGGLPRITSDLERGGDGVLHLTNLQLYSPKLRLSGQGYRRRDGTFHIEARGKQAQYGALRMVLDGHIERPKVELLLDRPNEAMGVNAMRLSLSPTTDGYDYQAAGGSRLGPFTSDGQILLPHAARAVIQVAALRVAGTVAHGALRSDPGGFTGQLDLAGGGIDGRLQFAPEGMDQGIEAHLTLANATLPGPPDTVVAAGRIDGHILLADNRTTIDGTVTARGLKRGNLSLARLTANAKLVNGAGEVRAALAGRREHAFEFVTLAQVAPGRVSLTGRGSIDRRPLIIDGPMVVTSDGDGWAVAPTRVRFGGGVGTLSVRTGTRSELHADVSAMPLQLLDMLWPKLDLAGVASGRIDYRIGEGGRPSGRADVKVRGLSRAGLVLSSQPIDMGFAGVIDGGQAVFRAVAVSGGKTIGRAQGRFAPMGGGPTVAALLNAPMMLQVRYAGPADTLWRLSGVEVFDLSGPVAIGADIGGRLVDPQIRGSLKASGARIESAVTGTVITGLSANGRFAGPKLVLSDIRGSTPGGGGLSGNGTVDFSGGVAAFDLAFNAVKARLLDRDDLSADVTGPLKIRSSGRGGVISGDLRLDRSSFTLGRASAASKVPQLKVRDINIDPAEVIEIAQLTPWKLDLKVAGELVVRGLGIDSRWRTRLAIGGSADSPAATGTANLVRGDYEFAGRSFRLDRGTMRFRGESLPDPLLDIHAQAQVQGVDASVSVRGTGLHPDIAFTSVPALPQDELLSRLLFGTSITNLSAPEALQLASAIAALQSGSGSLDPINAVRRAVGLDRLRILPADIATGQKTAISAGKYIGRKLFVEVITDGQGYSATRIEYQVTRWLSLLSSVSTIGRTSANVRLSKDY